MAKNGGRVSTQDFYKAQMETNKTISNTNETMNKNHLEVMTALSGLVPVVKEHGKKIEKLENRKDRWWDIGNTIGIAFAVVVAYIRGD